MAEQHQQIMNISLNIQKESPFKLIIPREVEHKIRYHIRKFPSTEWSGFMFYDYTGSFEENNLVFTARDFVVLDIGSAGATSFADCPKVLSYAIDHDLLDCKEALIHSHHGMGAFFSSVDDNAIKQEAMNVNHFLSLVVDTRGTYVARVTKRNIIKQSIHQIISEETCYPTYEDQIICNTEIKEDTKDFVKETSEVIVYPLNIERELWEEDYSTEWESDIKEAYAARQTSIKNNTPSPTIPTSTNTLPVPPSQPAIIKPFGNYCKEPNLFDEEFEEEERKYFQQHLEGDKDEVDIYTVVRTMYTKQDIAYLILQIVSCCPFIAKDKISQLPQYAVKLPTLVKQRFEDTEGYYTVVDNFIDGLLEEFTLSTCDNSELMDEFMGVVSEDMQDLLKDLPHNDMMSHIINYLNAYLV